MGIKYEIPQFTDLFKDEQFTDLCMQSWGQAQASLRYQFVCFAWTYPLVDMSVSVRCCSEVYGIFVQQLYPQDQVCTKTLNCTELDPIHTLPFQNLLRVSNMFLSCSTIHKNVVTRYGSQHKQVLFKLPNIWIIYRWKAGGEQKEQVKLWLLWNKFSTLNPLLSWQAFCRMLQLTNSSTVALIKQIF